MIRFSKVLLIIFLDFLLLGGCKLQLDDNKTDALNNDVVAVINDRIISVQDWQAEKEFYLSYLPELRALTVTEVKQVAESVLERMINDEIILQEALKRGIKISDAEFSGLLERSTNAYPGGNVQGWLDSVAISTEFWHDKLREMLVIQKLVDKDVYENIQITLSEAKSYYQKNITEFNQPELRNVYHLQLRSKDLVNIVVRELKRGRSFNNMVEAYSVAIDRHNQGNLGFLDRRFLPEVFSKPLFALAKSGQITEPIETPYGYHIFKVAEILPAKRLKFEENLFQIQEKLTEEKAEFVFNKWFKNLKDQAEILINEPVLKRAGDF